MADPIKDLYEQIKRRGHTEASFEDWYNLYGTNPNRQKFLFDKMKSEGYIKDSSLEQFTDFYFGKKKSSPDRSNLGPLGGEDGSMGSESGSVSSGANAPTATVDFKEQENPEGKPLSIFEKARMAIDKLHSDNLEKANELNPIFKEIEGDDLDVRNAVDKSYDDLSPDEQERLDMLSFDEKSLRLEGKETKPFAMLPGQSAWGKWLNAKAYDYIVRDLTQEKLSDLTRPAWANINPDDKAWYDKQEAIQKSTRRFNFELNVLTKDQKNIVAGMRHMEKKMSDKFGKEVFDQYASDSKELENLLNNKDFDKLTEGEENELREKYEAYQFKWKDFIDSDEYKKLNKLEILYGQNQKKYNEIIADDGYEMVRNLMETKESIQKYTDVTHKAGQGSTLNRIQDNWVRAAGKLLLKGAGAILDSAENIIGDDEKGEFDEFTNVLMTFGDAANEYIPTSSYNTRDFVTQTKVVEFGGKEYHIDDGESVRDKDGYLVDSQEAINVLNNEDKHTVIKEYDRYGTQGFIGKTGQLFADLGMLMMTARLGGSMLQGTGMSQQAAMRIGLTTAAAGQVAGPLYDESLKIFGDTPEGRRKAGAFTLSTSTAIGAVNLLFGGELMGAGKGFLDGVIKKGAISAVGAKLAAGKTAELSAKELSGIVLKSFLKHGAQEAIEENVELGVEALSKMVAEQLTGEKFDDVLNFKSIVENSVLGFTGGLLMGGGNISSDINQLQRDAWYKAASDPDLFKSTLEKLSNNGFDIDNTLVNDLTRMANDLNKKKEFLGNKWNKHFDLVYDHQVAKYQEAKAKEAGMNDIAKQWGERASELEIKLSKILAGFEAEPVTEEPGATPTFNPDAPQQAAPQESVPGVKPDAEWDIDPETGAIIQIAKPPTTRQGPQVAPRGGIKPTKVPGTKDAPVTPSDGSTVPWIADNEPAGIVLEGTPKDIPGGTFVNYQGTQGFIIQNEDGTTEVQTLQGERILVESAQSGQMNEELGLREAPVVQLTEEEMVKVEQDPNAAVDAQQVTFDGENNTVSIHGNQYNYDGVESDADGNVTAIRVVDESGKTKYIRSKDAVTEIEIQKALYERGTNITSEQVQSKADELGIKPTNEAGTGGTSATSNVQPAGPVANNQGVEPTTVANSPNGEGGGPDTPSPSPNAEADTTPKIENVERGLKKVTIGDQVFTLRRDSEFEADRPNGWFLRAGENVDPAGEVLGEFRNLQEAKDGITGLNLTGQPDTNTQQEGESASEAVKTPQQKQVTKESKEAKEAQDVFKNLAKGDISHEGAVNILEKNGQEVPFGLYVGAFMEDSALMDDPDTRSNMAQALEKYSEDLAYDVQQGVVDPITVLKAYNELGVTPPTAIAEQIGKQTKPPQGNPLLSKADKKAQEKQAQIRKDTGLDKMGEKSMTVVEEQIAAIDQAIADIEAKMTEEQLANRYNMNAGIPINLKLFNLHVIKAYHLLRKGVVKFTDFLNNIREKFSEWWAKVWHRAKEINLNLDKYNQDYGWLDKTIQLLQDKDRFVLRLKRMYERAGIPVPGATDFYTKKQLEKSKSEFAIQLVREEILGKNKGELGHKKSRKNSLVGRVLDATGYTVDQFSDFLYALHAKQYNARGRAIQRQRQRRAIAELQKRIDKAKDEMAIRQMANMKSDKSKQIANWNQMIQNILNEPIIDKASGMTDAEADAILDQARNKGVYNNLETFAKEFHDKVTKRIPKELYEGQLIDKETHDKLLNGDSETGVKFDWYIPLLVKQDAYDAAHELDFSILDVADDPQVAKMMVPTDDFVVQDREQPLFSALVKLHQAISQAEQNMTKVALADMIIDDVQTSKMSGKDAVHKYEVIPTVKVPSLNMMGEPVMFTEMVHPAHGSTFSQVSMSDIKDNSIQVRINGETKYIFFAPVQNEKTGERVVHPVVRSFKKSPQKVHENIQRGMNIMRGVVGVYRLMLTTWYPDFAIANFVRDFQDAIVMVNRFREDKNGAKLMKDIAMAVPNAAKVMFKSPWLDPKDPMAKDLMEAYGAGMRVSWTNYEGVEKEIEKLNNFRYDGPLKVGFSWVANRLGYLSDATEGIMRLATYNAMRKNGVDVQEAANIAKNITINFETKGTAGPVLNSMFLFLNAGIQGAANSVRLLKSGRGRKFVAASVGMGMMMRALSNMLAGDDEEWLSYKNNDLTATYNTLIYNPVSGGVIKIPKPYSVFRVSTWFGESAVDLFTGDMNRTDITVQGIQQLFAVFDPYGGGMEEPSKFFVPTIFLPLVQLNNNKTWYGTEAYRFNYDKGVPDYLQYNASTIGKGLGFEGTSLFYPYIDLAEDLNDMAALDMSPTTYEYLVDRYVTGAPKFLNNIMQTTTNIGQGEFQFKDAPVIRRFYTQLTEDERLNLYNLYQVLDAPYSTEFTPKQQDNMVRFLSRIYDKKVLPEDTYWKIFDAIYEKGFMFPKDREYYRKMENEFKNYEYLRDKERLKEEQERIKHFK